MSQQEIGTCSICDIAKVAVTRKYYYYNIKCTCCNNLDSPHFEIVYHCATCIPKPPLIIKAHVLPINA